MHQAKNADSEALVMFADGPPLDAAIAVKRLPMSRRLTRATPSPCSGLA